MTIEEKAKAYDETIKRAKEWEGNPAAIDYIFPELSEFRNEKVRKALIDFFSNGAKYGGHTNGVYDKDILAWLERQGEHANFRNKIQVGDRVTRNEAGVLVNLSQLNRVAKPEENKGNIGGISTNWSEEEIEKAAQEWDSKANFNPFYMTMDGDKPTGVKQHITTHKESFKAGVNWILKFLKGRIQPKQEWSEEDEKMIESLIESLTRISANTRTDSTSPNYSFYKEIDWLKSLRPQNKWKPSKEQIRALKHAFTDGSITFAEMEILATLYEGLKSII